MDNVDDFDFKPFFDLVVGMLFVLIIMVSAGLIFQQYNPEQENAKLEEVSLEKEITLFLFESKKIFDLKGMKSELNLDKKTIFINLNDFMKEKAGGVKEILDLQSQLSKTSLSSLIINATSQNDDPFLSQELGTAIMITTLNNHETAPLTMNNIFGKRLIRFEKQNNILQSNIVSLSFEFLKK